MFSRNEILLMSSFLPAIVSAQSSTTKVLLDPTFRTPAAPGDAFIQDPHHVNVVKAVLLAISLFFVAVSISEARRFQTSVPFALAVSGIFCVVPEAVNNYIGGVYWTQSHDPKQILFMLMGREFDHYVAIIWWSFASGVGVGLYAALTRGVSTAKLWGILALAVVADIILEEVLLAYGGIYLYFGHQPLTLNLFPCWWGFANVSSLFLGVSLAFRYKAFFEGWRGILLALLVPTCYIGAWTFCGMPTIFAIQGDFEPVITELAGLYTCLVAVLQSAVMMHLVLGRDLFMSKNVSQTKRQ